MGRRPGGGVEGHASYDVVGDRVGLLVQVIGPQLLLVHRVFILRGCGVQHRTGGARVVV